MELKVIRELFSCQVSAFGSEKDSDTGDHWRSVYSELGICKYLPDL